MSAAWPEGLFDAIAEAHAALRDRVRRTPLSHSLALSAQLGCRVLLKNEHLQVTGSFKYRGASNRIRMLSDVERRRGVITASTGNHGRAVARAGAAAGVAVTVYLADAASSAKREAIRREGATLHIIEGEAIAAELAARRDADAAGTVYIPPYNDPAVIAGQGTIGMELSEQSSGLDAVFVAIGGGGLVSGIGTALKRLMPATTIVGVWPETAIAMLRAMETGAIVDTPALPTLSDGTAGAIEPGSITLPLCQTVVDRRVTVSEAEIASAMRRVAETDHWMVEGAAGVALAGLLQRRTEWVGGTVAVVLCGRNIGLQTYLAAIGQGAV